jgi:hypothetical protein
MPPKQLTTLTSLFSKAVKAPTAAKTVAATEKTVATTVPETTTTVPQNADKDLAAFYASLTPNERKAHAIAVIDLGTSYNVRATHGFVRWSKHRV